MNWEEFNKQSSGGTITSNKPVKLQKSGWDAFNTQMTQNSFQQEAFSQNDVDPVLFQRLKNKQISTKEIDTVLKPEKTSFIKELGKTVKDTVLGLGGQMLRTIRGTSQVLATPLAGALALPKGGATPSQAMKESLMMAKDVAYNNSVSIDKAVEDAGQMWLKNRGVGKYGGKDPDIADVAALGVLGVFNLFGDPAFEFGALKPVGKAVKEFATFKKVGQTIKELEAGQSFVKGTQIPREIKISDDLKIKIKPKENTVVFEGYKKRFSSQKALPDNQMANETQDLVMSTREATGMELQAKLEGNDLILKPTQPIAKNIQPATNPLVEEAKKYKSAEEFVKSQKLLYHGTDKATAEAIRKAGGFTDDTAKIAKDLTNGPVDPAAPVSLTLDKATGELYAGPRPSGDTGELLSFSSKNLRIATEAEAKGKKIDQLRSEGYDGFHTSNPHDEMVETIIFNKSKLKPTSESQLTDIWNEANKQVEIPKIIKQTKQSKLGVRVKEEAVEEGLVKQMRGLPEYETMNMKEQAKLATELINSDLEKAKRIALGEEIPEGKLLSESVFIAMKNWAKQNKDVALIRQLAKSHTVEQATFMGQRIRALGETDPNDPVKIIRDIEQLRAKKVSGKPKEILTEEQKKIQREIKAVKKSEKDLEDFIQAIKC